MKFSGQKCLESWDKEQLIRFWAWYGRDPDPEPGFIHFPRLRKNSSLISQNWILTNAHTILWITHAPKRYEEGFSELTELLPSS